MKNFYKIITTAAIAFAIITGFTYAGLYNKASADTAKDSSNKFITKCVTSNKSDSKPIRYSSNIVIYNSEPYEMYSSGKKVTDIGNLLNNKLIEKGMHSSFIKNTITNNNIKDCFLPYKEYIKTYDVTRKLITQNVKNYNNSILLDLYRDKAHRNKSNIKISLVKNNPHYAENKKFADSFAAQLTKLGDQVIIDDYNLTSTYFNQDLSNRSIALGIGDINSSDTELEQLVNSVSVALQRIQ